MTEVVKDEVKEVDILPYYRQYWISISRLVSRTDQHLCTICPIIL